MRISDWSSDVCSSDLVRKAQVAVRKVETQAKQAAVAVEKKIAAVSEPMIAAAVNITPSPLSRAFLATSAGKKEVAEHPEIIAHLDDHGAPESQSYIGRTSGRGRVWTSVYISVGARLIKK